MAWNHPPVSRIMNGYIGTYGIIAIFILFLLLFAVRIIYIRAKRDFLSIYVRFSCVCSAVRIKNQIFSKSIYKHINGQILMGFLFCCFISMILSIWTDWMNYWRLVYCPIFGRIDHISIDYIFMNAFINIFIRQYAFHNFAVERNWYIYILH